jgi:NarL family two-component system sensor histidine kinase LiaS
VRIKASIRENLSNTFRQLRWRLTWSYTAVTVGALLVVVLVLALLVLPSILLPRDLVTPGSAAFWVQAANEQAVPLARYLLSDSPPNTEGIAALVNSSDTARFGRYDLFRVGNVQLYLGTTTEIEMLILGADGSLLGRTNLPAFPSTGRSFEASSIPGLEAPLRAALAGERDPDRLVAIRESGQALIVAAPVFRFSGSSSQLLGAVVYVGESMPTEDEVGSHTMALAGRALILFIFGAGVMGAIFGSLTAKRMASRLRRLARAANAWSQGDFSEFIDDPAGDEISQLAQRLNRMADQLQSLLNRRQEMAVSEERNRLARDLHDSAKQQALAASFQLGTALTLFERDPQAAKEHLVEADNLLDAVRVELTDLIHELRPPAANGQGLAETFSDYVFDWAHQNGVQVDLSVQGTDEVPLEVKQALFRITQEALANVARHSGARNVRLSLTSRPDAAALTICDDGCGFDTSWQHEGLGLHSMRERAESLSGEFLIKSEPGQGTCLSVTLPTG